MALYAISYDDREVLSEFAARQAIPYPLLSDVDSEVIRRYGILNDQLGPSDGLLYGIPYPGVYVTDAEGAVVAKFFHDSYKKRDSPEWLLDAALGRRVVDPDAPTVSAGEPSIRITATVHGGGGTIRQGIRRALLVRFDLDPGLHVYGEPAPDGMVPASVRLTGPPGLVVEDAQWPPSRPLRLEGLGIELQVWEGSFEVVVPFYATGELASETRPLDATEVSLEVAVRYQACDDAVCLLPRTETLPLTVPLDVIDIPRIALHAGHGQREGAYDGTPHLRRLLRRKIREHPLGFVGFVAKNIRLELAARLRARRRKS